MIGNKKYYTMMLNDIENRPVKIIWQNSVGIYWKVHDFTMFSSCRKDID